MKIIRVVAIGVLGIITLLVTNLPGFHLHEYFGLPNSNTTDIICHGIYYFVVTSILIILYANISIPVIFLFILLLIPAILEVSQLLMPGRTVSAYDLLGNYLGLGAAILLNIASPFILTRISRFFK